MNKDQTNAGTQKPTSSGDETDSLFTVLSDGGALYDVVASPPECPTRISLRRRDPITGRQIVMVSMAETSPAQFVSHSYRFAVDHGTFYVVRRRLDGNTEVWKMEFSPRTDSTPVKILDQNLGFAPYWLTVYHKQLMLAGTSGMVFRWDLGSDQRQTFQYASGANKQSDSAERDESTPPKVSEKTSERGFRPHDSASLQRFTWVKRTWSPRFLQPLAT